MVFSSGQLNPELWAHYDEHTNSHGSDNHQHLSPYNHTYHTGPSSDGLSPLSGNPNDSSPQGISSDSHDINALLGYDSASTTIQNLNDFLQSYHADPTLETATSESIYIESDLLGPPSNSNETKHDENNFQGEFTSSIFKTQMPKLIDLSLPSSSSGSAADSNFSSILPTSTSEEFTPLLSPAVTPFESITPGILPVQDFVMPVPYVEGSSPTNEYQQPPHQQHQPQQQNQHQQRKQQTPKQEAPKNLRPIRATPVIAPYIASRQQNSKVIKQSPSIKPSRRPSSTSMKNSGTSSPVISTSRRSSLILDGVNDISMPPPRKPLSSVVSDATAGSAAVTPASLMNLPESKDVEMLDTAETEQHLRNAVLATKNASFQVKRKNKFISPAPIAISPSMAVRGRQRSIASSSPRVPIALSPKVMAAPGSTSTTPLIKAKVLSTSASTSASISSTSGRHGSRSTFTHSPSLRPKISPLLAPNNEPKQNHHHHRSSSSSDLSALLASKSNYQNIMEGNHSQLGLSYPEQLSAEITSKRTSHKLAEQGRRNRINSALSDLGNVLGEGFQASSKASIVEMSIMYIKALQEELDQTKARLSKYEDVSKLSVTSSTPTNPEALSTETKDESPEPQEPNQDTDEKVPE